MTLAARRVTVALIAGVVCFLAVLVGTGLITAQPAGAADNGDGSRLYCGAGLVPGTPDKQSNWKGGVVLQFDRGAPCPDPIPSSALPVLRAAAHASGDGWSLARLGWLYALLAAAVTTVAAWAATGGGLIRVLVLVPPVAPLADADFSRFFLSTFSEPAGLLGAFALICGVGVVAVTGRTHRVDRVVGLALLAGGGLLAVTAKSAYAPLLGIAVVACAVTAVSLRRGEPRWRNWLVGTVLAVVVALVAIAPISAALDWQARHYPAVNAHNLIYTTVLTEIPGSAAALGLPANAGRSAGEAYFPNGPAGVPGTDLIAAAPTEAQQAGLRTLAGHPAALLRSVGIGMQATKGAALSYLPSVPWTVGTPGTPTGTVVGEEGADAHTLRAWLDGMSAPWWPSVLAALGILAGIAGAFRRKRAWSAFARLAGVAALSAVGVCVAAVLGDGYFEVAKHVWLAAYLLDVTLLGLVGAVVIVGTAAARRSTSPPGRAPALRRSAHHHELVVREKPAGEPRKWEGHRSGYGNADLVAQRGQFGGIEERGMGGVGGKAPLLGADQQHD